MVIVDFFLERVKMFFLEIVWFWDFGVRLGEFFVGLWVFRDREG